MINRNIPVISVSHGSDVPGFNKTKFSFVYRTLLLPFVKTTLKRVDGIISVSMGLNLKLKQFTNKDVEVIHNGCSDYFYNSPKAINLQQHKYKLINVGRLIPLKNHKILIYALSELRKTGNYSLTIVGSGPEEKKLKILAKSLNVETDVNFTGFISNEQLPSYLMNIPDKLYIPIRSKLYSPNRD